MEHVHMDQVQTHPRERFPEEGDVEARAVERDEHLGLSERTGKVLEVLALDKRAFPPPVVNADHGDGVSADGKSGRLDVEVHDVPTKRIERAPLFPRRQLACEVPMAAGTQGLSGPFDLVLDPSGEALADSRRRRRRRGNARPPGAPTPAALPPTP